jgi:hypothetical protein
MERGSAKHSPRRDEALAQAAAGELGPGGSNREEWAAAEPPADDDPPQRTDLPPDRGAPEAAEDQAASQDEDG